MRERVSLALWETVVATYAEVTPPKAEGGNEGGDGAAPLPTVLPMLSVRLKALKQMGKLHGLGCKSRASATAFDPPPYATPEEIAEMVRERRRGSGV
ncbi:MAG: hypothetical protein B7Z40_09195 [Bosea sp. 12-68-7]|nr:MAG: hypothetical protein B7Z40_09195 [Bosea sp. 12-68-7]